MKSILIVGAGKFGGMIARRLAEFNCEVMVIDTDEQAINRILPYVSNAIIGDCTDEEFVETLGVDNYDVCFVSIGNAFQTSLEVTALLKDAGAKHLVSRASSNIQSKFLSRIGADEIIYPEKMMATRIATRYASDNIIDFIQLSESDYSIYELRVPDEWDGKTLREMNLRKKHNVNIIAIRRNDTILVPDPDDPFDSEDVAFAIGETPVLQKLFKIR